MDTHISLLKSTVYEHDEARRLNKACKALKQVSTVLPFKKKNLILLEDDDLFKYLLLVYPIVPSTTDMVVFSMIDLFNSNPKFWQTFWKALKFLTEIEEKDPQHSIKHATLKMLSANVVKTLQSKAEKIVDYTPTATVKNDEFTRFEYPKEIVLNAPNIKIRSFEYLEALLKVYVKSKKDEQLEVYIASLPSIIRKNIETSNSEKVMNKGCYIMQILKNMSNDPDDPEFDLQELMDIKHGIQPKHPEMKISEKKENRESKSKVNNSHRSIERSGMEESRKHSKHSETHSEKSSDNEEEEKSRKSENESDDGSGSSNHTRSDNEEPDPDEEQKERVLTAFQTFLCREEVPLFFKDEFMAEAMKSSVNFEALIALMLDPKIQIISPCWSKTFPQLLKSHERRGTLSYNIPLSPKRKTKFKEHLDLVVYQIRSFKVLQCLVDERNYRYIVLTNNKILENLFNMVYISLARDELYCNMNHVAKLMLFCLQKEEKISLNYLIHFNLPFRFLSSMEFQVIQHFFLTILQFSDKQPIQPSTAEMFYRYFRYSEFFVDVAKAVLDGEDALDSKKSDQAFKPGRISELINLKSEATVPDGNQSFESSNETRKNRFSVLPEEDFGLKVDIDRCKDSLMKRRPSSSKSKKMMPLPSLPYLPIRTIHSLESEDSTHVSNLPSLTHLEKLKKYPSLREKWDKHTPLPQEEPPLESFRSIDDKKPRPTNSKDQARTPKRSSTFANNLNQPLSAKKRGLPQVFDFKVEPNTISQAPSSRRTKLPSITVSPKQMILSPKLNSPPTQKDASVLDTSRSMNASRSQLTPGKRAMPKRVVKIGRSISTSPFTMDESLEATALDTLNGLYPLSVKAYLQSDLDKESKKSSYQANYVKDNDNFSLLLAELLRIIVQMAVENDDNIEFKKKLNIKVKDYSKFWQAMLEPQKCKVFELLFKNYLFKIKVHHLKELNSGFECGQTVNLFLKHCRSNPHLKNYSQNIMEIARKFIPFLVKQIIYSHVWVQRKDTKVYLQSYVLNEPIGAARIMLLKTLNLWLKLEKRVDPVLLAEINDTCCHTLILWLFQYKTNNFYHNEFCNFMELTFQLMGEKHALNMLFKLDLLTKMHNLIGEIYKNGIKISDDDQSDSLISCFKRILKLISSFMNEKGYEHLRTQLKASLSWEDLCAQLIPKPTIVKMGSKKLEKNESPLISPFKEPKESSSPLLKPKNKKIETSASSKDLHGSTLLPPIQSPRGSNFQQNSFKSMERSLLAKAHMKNPRTVEPNQFLVPPSLADNHLPLSKKNRPPAISVAK